MNSQSIEFQKTKDNISLVEIVRNDFRVPIEEMENIFLVIRETKYKVVDISQGGIGIRLEDNSVFTIDETVEDCELHIFDHLFKNLKCRIVHLSSVKEKPLHCGIKWTDLDRQSSDQLNETILKMKDKLLNQD